jgi:hypothetical protein
VASEVNSLRSEKLPPTGESLPLLADDAAEEKREEIEITIEKIVISKRGNPITFATRLEMAQGQSNPFCHLMIKTIRCGSLLFRTNREKLQKALFDAAWNVEILVKLLHPQNLAYDVQRPLQLKKQSLRASF